MIEFLRSIEGPDFLLYYGIYSIVILVLLRIAIKMRLFVSEDSLNTRLSPYMAALIKKPNNIEHFISTIITELYAKKVIDITNDNNVPQITKKQISSAVRLDTFEKSLLTVFHIQIALIRFLRAVH
jgi:hypothetical protein